MSPARFSAVGLRSYIEQVELPARSLIRPAREAEQILRFGGFVGASLEHHRQLERAMLHARRYIVETEGQDRSVACGATFIADRLAGAKGRFSRSWHAPTGGLWGALIYINTLLPPAHLLLPLAVGVACCEALHASGASRARIRWINDVLCGDLKIAGFLAESFVSAKTKEEYVLIGFGVNVNNHDFPQELRDRATSLGTELGRAVDLESFGYCFLAKLAWNIGLLHFQESCELQEDAGACHRDRHPLLERWRELSDSVGKRVVYGFDVVENPLYRATVTGISGDGGLRLKLEDGTEIVEHSGEIRYLR